METTKENSDFIKVLEKLKDQKDQEQKVGKRNIDEFDFHNMFLELEKTLKKYQTEHSKKNTESELKLSELTLTM